ncbi:hypothetical protein [Azospirillum sp.]|uniref:hypothetical protein n=1 Tax=Azospirillum sp. TaxID=34012 RepID=UPI003D75125D
MLTLAANDERLADPALLAVLLHAHTRPASELGDVSVTAVALSLYRSRPNIGAPPFFIAPPEAVAAPGGAASPEATRAALRRLLASGVARPLLAQRR